MNGSGRKKVQKKSVCPKTGKHVASKPRVRWPPWLFPVIGLVSSVWFLARVLSKPSRITYPCQRIAAPLAGGFLFWILGLITSLAAYRSAKQLFRHSRLALGLACMAVAMVVGMYTFVDLPGKKAVAYPSNPNAPMGTAKGINPGRVIWVHAPDATDWQGDGYYWEQGHSNQSVVDEMMSVSLRRLAGQASDEAAWDAFFHHFNSTHGHGDLGYQAGEMISVKVNLVASIMPGSGNDCIDESTYVQNCRQYAVNTSAEVMLALLRQLVYKAKVPQEDITIGDTLCYFVKHLWDVCHSEFPNVNYHDVRGLLGRTLATPSTTRVNWSNGATATYADYMPAAYVEAKYHINLANLKGHEGGGVTLCGKNYYGSLCRRPDRPGYYELHAALPQLDPGMGRYRTLVDLLGHKDTGGKGLLYMIDGLWSGNDAVSPPMRWRSQPFNNDWPSSLFVSQDPIAVDSVGHDFLLQEWPYGFPGTVNGGDDYLHEAALAHNPPSGTFYDPENDGIRMESLGVHEHWNNSTDRQYSRNLGTGNGIELLGLTVGPGI